MVTVLRGLERGQQALRGALHLGQHLGHGGRHVQVVGEGGELLRVDLGQSLDPAA